MNIVDKLKNYASNDLNVLLVGTHGIGKTTMVVKVAKELGLNLCYYSASTLDPYTEIVGVPKPVESNGREVLKFYKPEKILDAEFLFFDELNRAHPKVLNAVLEIIQFKSVNGQPLPKLKMVWAAINPPGQDYDVEDLDPALLDRFHVHLSLKAEFNMEYMKTKMSEETALVLKSWWLEDMSADQRLLVTPRRLEYIGFMIDRDLEWKDALIDGSLPHGHLAKKILAMKHGIDGNIPITKESLLSDPETFIQRAKEDPSEYIKIKEVVTKFSHKELFLVRNLLESMPKDLVRVIGEKKFHAIKKSLYEEFCDGGVKPQAYPKIYSGFTFEEFEANK